MNWMKNLASKKGQIMNKSAKVKDGEDKTGMGAETHTDGKSGGSHSSPVHEKGTMNHKGWSGRIGEQSSRGNDAGKHDAPAGPKK